MIPYSSATGCTNIAYFKLHHISSLSTGPHLTGQLLHMCCQSVNSYLCVEQTSIESLQDGIMKEYILVLKGMGRGGG